ncbi:hypothetical protein M501DRAFT_986350 [Patellaria atrata CBS 101060]|uniref:Uncharacterized protein n=1 Tax=Patellaria atrata CBS 101060 TaxID=1346257 RepID=A0A9P4VPQ4_9PEZI|nr:hypothetical protein M501DRAFT_986350 [Patellaria atrata CBS 101060]
MSQSEEGRVSPTHAPSDSAAPAHKPHCFLCRFSQAQSIIKLAVAGRQTWRYSSGEADRLQAVLARKGGRYEPIVGPQVVGDHPLHMFGRETAAVTLVGVGSPGPKQHRTELPWPSSGQFATFVLKRSKKGFALSWMRRRQGGEGTHGREAWCALSAEHTHGENAGGARRRPDDVVTGMRID